MQNQHTSYQELHTWLDGELARGEAQQLQEHLSGCDDCQQQADAVEAQVSLVSGALVHLDAEPVTLPSKELQLQKLHARLAARSTAPSQAAARQAPPRPSLWETLSRRLWWAMPAVAAGFLALVWVGQEPLPAPDARRQLSPRPPQKVAKSRLHPRSLLVPKGFSMDFGMLYASTSGPSPQIQVFRPGGALSPGDLVQFQARLSHSMHGMIVSLNQKAEVFSFVPFKGKGSRPFDALRKQVLPDRSSLELDGVLGPEQFLWVVRPKPFTYAQAKAAILKAWGGDARRQVRLPSPWISRSILVYKRKAGHKKSRP